MIGLGLGVCACSFMVVIIVMRFFNRQCDENDAQENENHGLHAANEKPESQKWNRNKNWNETNKSGRGGKSSRRLAGA